MRSSRFLAGMAITASLLVALVVLLKSGGVDDETDHRAWLPDLADRINEVESLRVRSDGHLVTVVRGDGQWRVEEHYEYPADETLVRGLLLDLAQASVLDEMTARPDRHASLGVSDLSLAGSRAVVIELTGADDAPLATVVLGDVQRGTERFARLAGQPQVLRVAPLAAVPVAPEAWLDRSVLDIPRLDIAQIDIDDLNGERIVLEAGAGGEMQLVNGPAGASVRYQYALNDFATTLSGLRFEAVRPAKDVAFTGMLSGTVRSRAGLVVRFQSARIRDETWFSFDPDTAQDASAQALIDSQRLGRRLGGWAYRLSEVAISRLARPMAELIEFESRANPDS